MVAAGLHMCQKFFCDLRSCLRLVHIACVNKQVSSDYLLWAMSSGMVAAGQHNVPEKLF